MPFCGECGNKLEVGAKFCGECGNRQDDAAPAAAAPAPAAAAPSQPAPSTESTIEKTESMMAGSSFHLQKRVIQKTGTVTSSVKVDVPEDTPAWVKTSTYRMKKVSLKICFFFPIK